MKVKICGLTRAEDVELAATLGADFVGFIFVPESPRCVTPEQARDLAASRGTAQSVGVFRDASVDEIQRIADLAKLDVIQLHGSETDAHVHALQLPTIKAVRVTDALPDTSTSADWLMFDTGGGTGRTFDWTLLRDYARTKPFFLAGGLTPDNVAEAMRAAPDALDLSSGVELSPGVKDPQKLRTLFERVKR